MATQPLPPLQTPRRPRFLMRWYYWLLLAAAAGYGLAFAMHWDNRAVHWVKESFESPAERQQSVWLPDYRAVIDAKLLPGGKGRSFGPVLRPADKNPVFGHGQEPVPGRVDVAGRCAAQDAAGGLGQSGRCDGHGQRSAGHHR